MYLFMEFWKASYSRRSRGLTQPDMQIVLTGASLVCLTLGMSYYMHSSYPLFDSSEIQLSLLLLFLLHWYKDSKLSNLPLQINFQADRFLHYNSLYMCIIRIQELQSGITTFD